MCSPFNLSGNGLHMFNVLSLRSISGIIKIPSSGFILGRGVSLRSDWEKVRRWGVERIRRAKNPSPPPRRQANCDCSKGLKSNETGERLQREEGDRRSISSQEELPSEGDNANTERDRRRQSLRRESGRSAAHGQKNELVCHSLRLKRHVYH